MKFKYLSLAKSLFGLLCGALIVFSCSNNPKEPGTTGDDLPEADPDTVKNTVFNVGGHLFSIPSPVQTSMLIQKTGAAYNEEVISSHRSDEYKETFFQSLNLGVFGADLGYVSMYNIGAKQLVYLSQAQKLSDALGISNAFDTQTMKRINDNIKIKDSLLVLVSVAYKSSDAFLKKNQRNEVSSLILVGGWVESLNFAAQVNKTKPNQELKMRIAYQKQAINSIVALLEDFKKFKEQPEFTALRDNLTELQKVYNEVKFTYVYEKPETDALNKVTTINSRTDVSITDAQVTQITEKIKALREWCLNGEKSK